VWISCVLVLGFVVVGVEVCSVCDLLGGGEGFWWL
jgi:hypothetical protein